MAMPLRSALRAAYRRYLEIRDAPPDPDRPPADWGSEMRPMAEAVKETGPTVIDVDGSAVVASVDARTGILRFDSTNSPLVQEVH